MEYVKMLLISELRSLQKDRRLYNFYNATNIEGHFEKERQLIHALKMIRDMEN